MKPQKAQVKDKGLGAECWDIGNCVNENFNNFVQVTWVTPKNELEGGLAGFSQGTKALLLKKGGYFD
jgi:hypothetical protein